MLGGISSWSTKIQELHTSKFYHMHTSRLKICFKTCIYFLKYVIKNLKISRFPFVLNHVPIFKLLDDHNHKATRYIH
jgi:hypothetical protein